MSLKAVVLFIMRCGRSTQLIKVILFGVKKSYQNVNNKHINRKTLTDKSKCFATR